MAQVINEKQRKGMDFSSLTPQDSFFGPKLPKKRASIRNELSNSNKQKFEFNISINSNNSSQNINLRNKFLEIYKKR